jgi:hypothetical protein
LRSLKQRGRPGPLWYFESRILPLNGYDLHHGIELVLLQVEQTGTVYK